MHAIPPTTLCTLTWREEHTIPATNKDLTRKAFRSKKTVNIWPDKGRSANTADKAASFVSARGGPKLWGVGGCLTHCFAGLGYRVHLVAFVTLALVVAFVVDADLTAGIRILTFVYVCGGTLETHQ